MKKLRPLASLATNSTLRLGCGDQLEADMPDRIAENSLLDPNELPRSDDPDIVVVEEARAIDNVQRLVTHGTSDHVAGKGRAGSVAAKPLARSVGLRQMSDR